MTSILLDRRTRTQARCRGGGEGRDPPAMHRLSAPHPLVDPVDPVEGGRYGV